jgi:hypothetical protein
VLPALEQLQTAWEEKRDSGDFDLYKDAIEDGLEKLRKYYSRIDSKPMFVLALGSLLLLFHLSANIDFIQFSTLITN